MNKPTSLAVAVVFAGSLALSACSVITPPPLAVLHHGAVPDEPGSLSVSAAGGVAGGVFIDGSAGGVVRVSQQVSEELALEGAIGGGWRVEDNERDDRDDRDSEGFVLDFDLGHGPSPSSFAEGRFGGRFNPGGLRWLALTFGAGFGGTDTGLRFGALDGGVLFGNRWSWFELYGGPFAGVSVPFEKGRALDHGEERADGTEEPIYPEPTQHLGTLAGLKFHLNDAWAASLEGVAIGSGQSDENSAAIMGVTAGLTCTFGGADESESE